MERLHLIIKSTDKEWLMLLMKTESPALVRVVALRFYALGEKDLALKTILDQMNRYKDPATSMITKVETCRNAALDLGQLGDPRAIPDLIEAMDVYTFPAAFSLSLLDGEDLKKTLHSIITPASLRGIGAIFALGLMGDVSVFPYIADIVKNMKFYEDKFFPGRRILPWISYDILYILGNYENAEAERLFLEEITIFDISLLIHNYAFEEGTQAYKERTQISTIGWRIVKKFGWDKYMDKPDTIKMLMDRSRTNWQKEVKPFIDLIWGEIRKRVGRE